MSRLGWRDFQEIREISCGYSRLSSGGLGGLKSQPPTKDGCIRRLSTKPKHHSTCSSTPARLPQLLCPSRNSSPRLFSASTSCSFGAGSSSGAWDIVNFATRHEDRTDSDAPWAILSAILVWLGPGLSRLRTTLRRGLVPCFQFPSGGDKCVAEWGRVKQEKWTNLTLTRHQLLKWSCHDVSLHPGLARSRFWPPSQIGPYRLC